MLLIEQNEEKSSEQIKDTFVFCYFGFDVLNICYIKTNLVS